MKKITITYESGNDKIIYDEDDTDILEYSKKISGLMSASNVSLLETSERVVVIRPHKIEAIDVIEVDSVEPNQEIEASEEDEEIDSINQEAKEHIDIIKDATGE